MTESEKTPLNYSPGNRANRSCAIAALITFASGVLLAGGSCSGAISSGGRGDWTAIFTWGLVIGVLLILAGILLGLVAFVLHVFGSKRE